MLKAIVNGQKLRECRKQSGLKTTYIAERLGVQRQAIYLYEQERRTPSLAVLFGLSELYGSDIKEFIKKG